MRMEKIWAIARKDMLDMSKSKYVFLSIIFMPIIFGVVLPAIQIIPLVYMDPAEITNSSDDMSFMANFKFTDDWNNLNNYQQFIVMMIEFSLILFLLIPIIMPTVAAADSFVGEKDRKTAEGLVVAPITDEELYLGKVFGSLIPTIVGTIISAIGFIIVADWVSYKVLDYLLFPDLIFVLLVFVLSPIIGFITTNLMIYVSARSDNSRDAQQLGGLVALPLMAFIVGALGLSIIFSIYYLVLFISLSLIISYFAMKFGMSLLDREKWISQF